MKPLFNYILKNQVILALILILSALFLFYIRSIVIIIFIAYILMAGFYPIVSQFKKRRVPTALAILIPYVIVLSFLGLIIFTLKPFFVSQTQSLIENLPDYTNQAAKIFNIEISQQQIQSAIKTIVSGIEGKLVFVTSKIVAGVVGLLAALVFSVYMLFEHDTIKKYIINIGSSVNQSRISNLFDEAEIKLGDWIRGQITLGLVIGFFTWVALKIIGLEYALPLAIIAGVLEFIPMIGPLLSAIPAIIVGLSISPTMALTIGIVYIVIQFLENHLLVPKIMENAVGLSPLITIPAILIGSELMGVIGALLAIPFVSLLIVMINGLKELNTNIK